MTISTQQSVYSFWDKWYKANELERLDIVKTLTMPPYGLKDKATFLHSSASLINSYLEDLASFFEEKYK